MNTTNSDFNLLWLFFLNLFLLTMAGFIIILLGYLFKRLLKKIYSNYPDLVNNILALSSFFQFILWIVFAGYLFKFSFTFLIGSSTLFVAIIGISALGGFGSNILGGLWILFTHPYGVGDFISVPTNSQYSGLVIDVSINYTKILRLNRKVVIIPNGIMVNSVISNSNIIFDKNYIMEHRLESNLLKQGKSIKVKQVNLPTNLIDSIYYGEYVYFPFNFEIKVDLVKPNPTIETIKQKLNEICDRYSPIFGFKPEFYFVDYTARILVTIKIITRDPKLILNKYADLMQDIANKLYLDKFFLEGP